MWNPSLVHSLVPPLGLSKEKSSLSKTRSTVKSMSDDFRLYEMEVVSRMCWQALPLSLFQVYDCVTGGRVKVMGSLIKTVTPLFPALANEMSPP